MSKQPMCPTCHQSMWWSQEIELYMCHGCGIGIMPGKEKYVKCRFPKGEVKRDTEKRYMEIVIGYECKSVMDIGCGWGYGTYILAKAFERVAGIDNHIPYIEYARDHYPDYSINFVYWPDASALRLDQFDLYVAMEVLETFTYSTAVLRKWVESLEGILVGYTLDGRKPQERAQNNPYIGKLLTPDFVRSLDADVRITYTNSQYFWFEVTK